MSRQIRFRAWDKDILKMLLDVQEYDYTSMSQSSFGAMLRDNSYVVMQFTGLHDKNGKEIWEGDIVMVLDRDWASCSGCHKSPREHMIDISFKCPVVFENGAFILKSAKPNKFDNEYDYVPLHKEYGRDLFEVLGNIYENKELLK